MRTTKEWGAAGTPLPLLSRHVTGALLAVLLGGCASAPRQPPAPPAEDGDRLVLVTLDGLRWQELFRGADPVLAANAEYVEDTEPVGHFVNASDRAGALMPFLHHVVAREGVLIGNRDRQSCAEVDNPWWFSYPGYNEILTGRADPTIDSNDKIANRNVTILEWLNHQPHFAGQVAAFGSWDVFDHIVNEARSGVPVNSGFEPLRRADSAELRLLNRLQAEVPSPWDNVRLDAFTHEFALWTLRHEHPRALFVAYGETDDFAHDGRYDAYLASAHRTDGFLRELWEALQADPFYAGRTTLLVTTDHGRGGAPDAGWRHHASPEAMRGPMKQYAAQFPDGVPGANQTWIAALGPDIDPAQGGQYHPGGCARNTQLTATALRALHLDADEFSKDAAAPLDIFK